MSSWACLSDCFGPRYQPIINPNPIEGMLPGTREVTYYADIENSHAEKKRVVLFGIEGVTAGSGSEAASAGVASGVPSKGCPWDESPQKHNQDFDTSAATAKT